MTALPGVVRIESYALRVVERAWPFAASNAAAIAANWQARSAANPSFFNGPIHLLSEWHMTGGCFSGAFIRTDFASYLYWRDQGYADPSMIDCFGSAVLRSSDGKILLGRQAPGHVNSGLTYFPGGFIDDRDVTPEGAIDIAASVRREAGEELGFADGTFAERPGAHLVRDGQLLCIAIDHVSPLDAETLLTQARRFIAGEPNSELEHVLAVATRAELSGLAMPGYARALLEQLLP